MEDVAMAGTHSHARIYLQALALGDRTRTRGFAKNAVHVI